MKFTSTSLVLTLSLAVSSQALAQPKPASGKPTTTSAATTPTPPKPKSLSETLDGPAKADYERAKLFVTAQPSDWKNAQVNFQLAYEKSKDPRLLWNIAACFKNQQKYARTVENVRKYVSEGGDLISSQDRKDAADLLAVIEPLTTTLELTVSEADAKITIDGEPLGMSPLAPTLVDASGKTLSVTKPEYEDFNEKVDLEKSDAQPKKFTRTVTLVRIKHEGKLTITAGGADDIYLDGQLVGKAFWSSTLKSGGYQLKVVAPGMKPYQTEVVIADHDDRSIPVQLEADKGKGLPLWAYITGGVVLAGAAVVTSVVIINNGNKTENNAKGTFDPGFANAFRF